MGTVAEVLLAEGEWLAGRALLQLQVAIRQEDIIVSRTQPRSISAQNVLETTLDEILNEGQTCSLLLRVNGTRLNALVTHNAVEQLKIDPGDTLYALNKSSHVRIIPATKEIL